MQEAGYECCTKCEVMMPSGPDFTLLQAYLLRSVVNKGQYGNI